MRATGVADGPENPINRYPPNGRMVARYIETAMLLQFTVFQHPSTFGFPKWIFYIVKG